MVAGRDAHSTRIARVLDEAAAEDLATLAVQSGVLTAAAVEEARLLASRDGLARVLGRLLTAEQLEALRARQRQRDIDRIQRRGSDTPDAVRDVEGDPSRRFDRFVLVERAGRGASGQVWKAWDPQVRRWVAIKILAVDSAHARERFLREAHIAGTLRHPNLVTVHDAGDWQGRAYMVMEFIEGVPLAPSPERDALGILRDAAAAVGLAHRRGVVHRDLKPSNILVDATGIPHVVDFGLARESGEARLTRTGAIVGTPLYMAPEQVNGNAPVSPRSDVYALGCILYEALTGHPPHLAPTVPEVYSNLLRRDAAPPRRINPAIAPALEIICLKALDRDPAYRYADAGEFAEDMDRYLRGETVRAQRAPLIVRLSRAPRVAAAAAAIATIALVAGAYGLHRASVKRRAAAECDEGARLEASGRAEDARDGYARAQRIDPSNERAAAAIARLARRAESRERALKLLETARPALDRAQSLLYESGATPHDIAEQVDRAQPLVEKAAGMAPDMAMAHFLAGACWELRGRDDRAEESWRQALEADARFAPAHLQLGKLLGRRAYLVTLGSTRQTLLDLSREAQRYAVPAQRHIDTAIAEGAGVLDDMERAVADCMVAMSRLEVDEMGRRARQALPRYRGRRGSEELVWILAMSTVGGPRFDGLKEALVQRPHFAIARLCLAIEHRLRGDSAAAIEDANHALALNPTLAPARWERAMAYSTLGRLAEAEADFEECVAAGWRPAASRVSQARMRAEAGRRAEAFAAYAEAIRLDPQCGLAHYNRANLHREDGNFAAALADLDRALEIDPTAAEAWNNRAVVRMALNDLPAALEDLRNATQLNPSNAHAWRNMGSIFARRADSASALAAYDKALAADPQYARARYERAVLRASAGSAAGAIEDLEALVKHPPKDAELRADAEKLLARLRPRRP